jgi:tetratricopeptide (TPR) repeat protein
MPAMTLGPWIRSMRSKRTKLPPGIEDPELKNFFAPDLHIVPDVDVAIAFFLKKAETASEGQARQYVMAARACLAKHMETKKNATGDLMTRLGETERAETYYRKALEVDPRSFPALTELAGLLGRKHAESPQLMERAALVHPHPFFLLAVGDFYRDDVKNNEKAYLWYLKSHDAAPSKEARRRLAAVCKSLGKLDETKRWNKRR